ncbi:MAG TPA: DedA family protein [Candidatus Acidoferrum sp.]|nr:DedA family protein [Candidatus Acidoferrum sp.]
MLFGAGLGVPLPEEIPVLAAGVLSHEGIVRWWIALPLCLVAILAGDSVLYWVGHHWGEHILDWRVVRHVLTPKREEELKAAYRRHGMKIVFAARHVAGFRAAAFLTAGIARLPFAQFIAVDAAAALLGVPLSFGLAFFFADQLEWVLADVHRIERWLAIVALTVAAGWLAVLAFRRARRVADEARGE